MTQAAYILHITYHSCEILLLKLIEYIMVTVDGRLGVVLLIIDLSAAFDTVDHGTLLNILHTTFLISGAALAWFRSFLTG